MNTFTVPVKASLMKSLVRNRGMTYHAVAEKAKIDESALLEYSQNDSEIDRETLVKLAKVFHKSWTVFLLDTPEPPAKYGQDNRTLGNQQQGLGPELVKILQDTTFMLEVSSEIDPDYKVDLPMKQLSTKKIEASLAGEQFRKALKLNEEECDKIRGTREMLNHWKTIVQDRGIYISERALPLGQVRAFSLVYDNKAAIVLSTKDSYAARSFSLFHEVCHILLKSTGVCDLNEFSTKDQERYCNQFAAAFLAPADKLAALLDKYKAIEDHDELVERIATALNISKVAASIRLNEIGVKVKIDFHLEALKKKRKNDGTSSGNYYATTINAAGVTFSKHVFNAVSDGVISMRDAAHFLGVGEKNVNRFKSELYRYHPNHELSN